MFDFLATALDQPLRLRVDHHQPNQSLGRRADARDAVAAVVDPERPRRVGVAVRVGVPVGVGVRVAVGIRVRVCVRIAIAGRIVVAGARG